jgi:hypothetical protein
VFSATSKKIKSVIALARSISDSLNNQNKILSRQNGLLQEQISFLQEQNRIFSEQSEQLREQKRLSSEQLDRLKSLHWHLSEAREIQESIRVNLTVPLLDSMQKFLKNRHLGLMETLEVIRRDRLNLARFGDGELDLMLRLEANIRFQRNSPELMKDLEGVFKNAQNNPDKLLIGMPYVYLDNRHWATVYTKYWRQVEPMLEPIRRLANSQISRPTIFAVHGQEAVEAWRGVWQDLDITIVTGKGSRFDMLPDLFDNIKSHRFEYSLPIDAYSDIPRLIETLRNDTSELILISLGPAGTILASELAKHGKWALDIGHVSNSYHFQLKGGKFPEKLPVLNAS